MDLQLFRSFLVLAKTQNFTQAAKKLNRTQSALSLQILRLEERLGKRLFIRTGPKITLSFHGEELLGYAQRILRMEEEILEHFHEPTVSGEVKFGIPEDLATSYLPQALASFKRLNPSILLNVHCEFTLNLLNGFNDQKFDLILIKQDPMHRHPASQEVWNEQLVWVSAKGIAFHEKIHEKTLPLILAPAPCVYRSRAIDALNKKGVAWRITFTSPSSSGCLAAVKAGLGISVLPINMVSDDLQILKELPPLQEAQIGLIINENSSKAAKIFGEYIAKHLF